MIDLRAVKAANPKEYLLVLQNDAASNRHRHFVKGALEEAIAAVALALDRLGATQGCDSLITAHAAGAIGTQPINWTERLPR